jgi:hypothetical protein
MLMAAAMMASGKAAGSMVKVLNNSFEPLLMTQAQSLFFTSREARLG